jgi:fluoroquinolone resistance protein
MANRKRMTDKVFDKVDFSAEPLQPGEYEDCEFRNCDLSKADLSDMVFIGCRFKDTNLSMAKLGRASFQEVLFEGCKMVGLHFEDALPFLMPPEFTHCILDLSSFTSVKLPKVKFKYSDLKEVDFSEADLSGCVFDHCNLDRAIFDRTNLTRANFSNAFHYALDPGKNMVKKAVFSLNGLPGLLGKYDIVIS